MKKFPSDLRFSLMAVLGPENTYTDMAASKYEKELGKQFRRIYFSTIADVVQAVEEKKVEEGIIPIENFLHGSVRETFDQLFLRKVSVIEKIFLPIDHVLAVLPGSLKKDICFIYSHDQALQQCGSFLRKHFPSAVKVTYSSTAGALQDMQSKGDKSVAVIVSDQAARAARLKVLAKNIQEQRNNHTIFVVIVPGLASGEARLGVGLGGNLKPSSAVKGKKHPDKKASEFETSIAFHFLKKDRPGSLFAVFQQFAIANINLTRIESRPSRKQYGDYVFFLDFIGSAADPIVKKVLKAVKNLPAKLKILGTYPFPPG